MKSIRVGIVEGDQSFGELLSKAVSNHPALQVTCKHDSLEKMLKVIGEESIPQSDIVLIDIGQSSKASNVAISALKNKFPKVEVIILSSSDDQDVLLEALRAGAHSYISRKTPIKDIINAIFTVSKGGSFMSPDATRSIIEYLSNPPRAEQLEQLTERQMDIIKGLSDGLSYKLIADRLDISIDTVRSHIKKIYKILDVHSKIEVINIYRNNLK